MKAQTVPDTRGTSPAMTSPAMTERKFQLSAFSFSAACAAK
jgi:hypothetical protein